MALALHASRIAELSIGGINAAVDQEMEAWLLCGSHAGFVGSINNANAASVDVLVDRTSVVRTIDLTTFIVAPNAVIDCFLTNPETNVAFSCDPTYCNCE